MRKLFFSLIALFSISMLVPMSFGELYYNNEYSFSVQYPDNWRMVDEDVGDVIVQFMDGVEEGSTWSLWESSTTIYLLTEMGEKLSDYEEKQWMRESNKEICDDATNIKNDYRCGSFKIISQVSGKSLDGYPTITTKSTETRNYTDLSNNIPMVIIEKYIYVDDDVWGIYTETDADMFSEYENKIYATMNSFRYPASPPVENSSDNGGGCLIATATYGSELAPQVQQLRELRDNQLMNTESGSAFMSGFNELYYSFSPTIADMEREHPMFSAITESPSPRTSDSEFALSISDRDDNIGVIAILTISLKYGFSRS